MELWVRSQDKRTLQKVDNIFLDANYKNKRISTYDGGGNVELGTYKTKERALEVLDEINDIKLYKYMASLDWNSFVSSIYEKTIKEQKLLLSMMNTYQMPKE